MWEFYLQICEVAFRRLNWMVFQAQITKSLTAVPLPGTISGSEYPDICGHVSRAVKIQRKPELVIRKRVFFLSAIFMSRQKHGCAVMGSHT